MPDNSKKILVSNKQNKHLKDSKNLLSPTNSNSNSNSALRNRSPTSSNVQMTTTSTINSSYSAYPKFNNKTDLNNNLNIQLENLPIKNSIISIIFDRIDILLPYKSGFSIAQVFADPNYIQARSHLLKLSDASKFIQDLISCIYNLLIQILKKDSANSLHDKNINVLNSIYIVIFLLSNFLDNIKSHESLSHSSNKMLQMGGLKTTYLMYKSNIPLKPTTLLDNDLSLKLLKLLLSLKNDSTCLRTLYHITEPVNINSTSTLINSTSSTSNLTASSNSNIFYHNSVFSNSMTNPNSSNSIKLTTSDSSSSTNSISIPSPTDNSRPGTSSSNTINTTTPSSISSASSISTSITEDSNHSTTSATDDFNEVKKLLADKFNSKSYDLINLIDESVSSVLIYIAATNPTQYLDFEKLIFKHINVDSLYIKGSHLVQFAFLTSTNFNSNIQFIRDILHVTKRNSQRSLLLHFFSESILTWAIYRTEDFLKAINYPLCCKNSEVLFDIIYRQMDPKYSPKVYYSILSCLFLFQPKQITKFINDKSNKSTTQALKRSLSSVAKLSSTRQKFLSDFSQLLSKSPEYGQPLILFLLVGCSIGSFEKFHPLYKYVQFMKDPLLKQLKLDKLENFQTYTGLNLSGSSSSYPSSIMNNMTPTSTSSMPNLSTINSLSSTFTLSSASTSTSNSTSNSNSNSTSTDSGNSLKPNLKLIYELKVGVFAIASIVNNSMLLDKLSSALLSSKSSIQILPLFTGAFRLLILIPLLSDIVIKFIQDSSSTFAKILSILCDHLTAGKKITMDNVNNQSLSSPLSKIPSSSNLTKFSSLTPTSDIKRTISNTSKSSIDTNKQSLRSPPLTINTNIGINSFKNSPLKLSHDDGKLEAVDITSMRSNDDDSNDQDTLHLFKLTYDENIFPNDKINYNLIKAQLPKCSYDLIKKNIVNLLVVYSSYPFLLYPDVTSNGKHKPKFLVFEKIFKKFINKVANLLYLDDDEIFAATETFLLSFCVTCSNIIPVRVFVAYLATSILIDSVSAVGISSNISNEKRNRIIKLILNLLEKRSEYSDLDFMLKNKNIIEEVHGSGSCRGIIKNFERIVFMGLFSNNIETIRISKRLLQFYVFVVTNPHHHSDCFDNSNLELANKLLADKMTFGIVSIRKKIRDHLCSLKNPTETLLSIWALMYEKVAISYNYKEIPEIDAPVEDHDEFFKNHRIIEDIEIYSEYLASLGGIIISEGFQSDIRQPILRKNLETFISNKFISLFSKNVKKREHSREILSVSIHPYLSEIVIDQIKIVLPKFENNLKNEEYNICEIFLSVLRSVCQIEIDSLFPFAVDLWNINFSLLNMFDVENNKPDFLRLKLKFCKLQILFLSKLKDLSLNGIICKKNEYARIAASYLENSFESEPENKLSRKVLTFNTFAPNSQKKLSSKIKEFKESEFKDLQMDIRVEASVMLKMILYKLPLDTPRHNYGYGISEDDKSTTSVVFSNYFNLFVRSLAKLNEMKNDKASYTAIIHRSSNIIKEVIQALINLLNANSQIGLKYSLDLGYHPDELIRVSFIDVFSKIIKDIYSTYEHTISKADYYETALKLFINDVDLFLSTASCCPKSDIEAYASSLLQLNICQKKKLELFLALIKFDVLHTSGKNEILRSNTVGTRVIALYSYEYATNYLIAIFRPIFQHMIIHEEFFEIEKHHDETEEQREKSLELFIKYLNMIADAILNSISLMPTGIRLISKVIYDSTIQVLPDSKFSSINAYLFLRLINPTIVSPERLGIVENLNPLFKRSLIQLARVIQTIVNESPVRISILESRPDELLYAKDKFFKFMKAVVDFDFDKSLRNIPETNPVRVPDEQFINSFSFFHSFYYSNWMEIRQAYYTQSFGNGISEKKKEETIRLADDLLSKTGLPKRLKGYEIPESVRMDKSPRGILLYDFLSRTHLSLENTSFIKVLITKDGLPLICINTLEFPEDITHESYCFAILQTLTKFWETPFCMLMDLTSFTNFTMYEQVRELLHSIVPSLYKSNCKRFYYVNLSSSFYEKFKNLEFNYSNEDKEVNPEFVFLSTNDDAKTMSKNKLIGYFNPITHDARVSFHDVSIYQENSSRFIPVKMTIGNQFLQLYSAMPQRLKILNKMHVINLVDCFKISELDEIAPSSFTGVANELSMINLKTSKRLIFTSTKKIEIMRTLYFSKARLNKNNFNEDDDYNPSLNPKFIVGQLLNTAFSGLLAKSDEIRRSSYALLSSIKHSVCLKTGKSIDSIDGVIFPYGDIDYICDISAAIAKNHPSLTYSFIYGFFNAYDKLSEEDQNSMVLCVSSWIRNIYTNVYLSDSIKGPNRASDIIRKCVRASRAPNNFQVFSLYIWPQLSLEDGLIELIIDEIVAAAIDHEAEGNDWQRITKYWPLRSSIEICSVIIRRMKEKSYNMPINESEIEAHTRWIETTVLAKFLAYLIFDSLLFVDRYISDIFFIITIFMDCGPLELRRCLLNLLTRTFHSYLSKPSLTDKQHSTIQKQIELLNGARFRMLFGLTREDDEFFEPFKIIGSEISNKANAVTTLCDLLTSFLENDLNHEEYALQMVKWNLCVSKIAFDETSQLQSKAILVMGSLTKQGVSNSFVLKFIDLLRINAKKYVESLPEEMTSGVNLIICTLHGFSKSILGIDKSSIFHPLIFWSHVNLLLCDNISFFKYGVEYLRFTLANISKYTQILDIKMVDYIFEYKIGLFSKTEEEYDFKLTKNNFDVVLVLLCCKGLESPYTYNESVETIKALLTLRYEEHLRYPNDEYNEYICYLFFIYLTSNNNEEMIETLENCGVNNIKYIEISNGFKIPTLLLEWFSRPTLNVYSTCLGATNYFMKQKLDELASTRVISLYVEMFKQNSKIILTLFRQVDGVLKKFVSSSGTPRLLETVLDMIVGLMNNPDYNNHQMVEEDWLKKLEDNNIRGITSFTFSTTKAFVDAALSLSIEDKQRKLVILDNLIGEISKIYKKKLDI
jgi:hypothetical protein